VAEITGRILIVRSPGACPTQRHRNSADMYTNSRTYSKPRIAILGRVKLYQKRTAIVSETNLFVMLLILYYCKSCIYKKAYN